MMAFSFSEDDEAAYLLQQLGLTGGKDAGAGRDSSKDYFEFPAISKNHLGRHKCTNCGEFSHNIIAIHEEKEYFCSKDCASSFYIQQGGFPESPMVSPKKENGLLRRRRPAIVLQSAQDASGSTYYEYSVIWKALTTTEAAGKPRRRSAGRAMFLYK